MKLKPVLIETGALAVFHGEVGLSLDRGTLFLSNGSSEGYGCHIYLLDTRGAIKDGDFYIVLKDNEVHFHGGDAMPFADGIKIAAGACPTIDVAHLSKAATNKLIDYYNEYGEMPYTVDIPHDLFYYNKRFGGTWQPFPDESEQHATKRVPILKDGRIADVIITMFTEKQMCEFSVWCGTNYVSYHSDKDGKRVWFDPENVRYYRTDQLLQIWHNNNY